MTHAIDVIINFCPKILIIPFGTDTVRSDPQGSFDIGIDDYKAIGNLIRNKFIGTIIVTQEGEYDLDVICTIVVNFLSGLIMTR